MIDTSAYALGYETYVFGGANPYPVGTVQWRDFVSGEDDAKAAEVVD